MLTKNTDILREEVAQHIATDALIRGTYWNPKSGKGCFIGCLTHSNSPTPAFERFGLPVPILHIAEDIFEALPDDEGRAFFAALPDAVGRDGKDLNRIHWAFLAAELRALPPQPDDIQAVIDPVIAGMDLLAAGKEWTAAAYSSDVGNAARAATHAARSADYSAHSAYSTAYASTAARHAAYNAAYYAAYGTTNAARNAVSEAAYNHAALRQRNTLLALISAA